MKRKYLYGILGLAIGIAISFTWTRSYNNANAGTVPSTSPSGAAGAPGNGNNSTGQQAAMGDVAKTIENAKNNPKDFRAQLEAASVFGEIGRKKEAVEYLEKAYEASPTEFAKLEGAFGYAGQFYFDEKEYTKAETWLNRAIEAEPNEPEARILLAETYMNREPAQPDKAIQHIQSALKLDAKNAHAMGHLVEAYALKKDARGAEDALNKLKESDPNNNRLAVLQTLVADLKAGKPVTIPKE